MRITKQQIHIIQKTIKKLAGEHAQITLFGSRVDDTKKGGDIDLLVTLPEPATHPAELSAKISSQLMRQFEGRKVDILLLAPNLKKLPIHVVAQQTGTML